MSLCSQSTNTDCNKSVGKSIPLSCSLSFLEVDIFLPRVGRGAEGILHLKVPSMVSERSGHLLLAFLWNPL